jgi:hypothetical protein
VICDPAVVELIGYEPASEYPFPLGASDAPERIYCMDGVPAAEPHGTFLASTIDYAVTLAPGTVTRRWWFSNPATNRANIATISNTTARPLEVVLFVQAGQSFTWWTDDFIGWDPATLESPTITARYDVGVLEGSLTSSPQMTYAPFGADAAVYQVNPTLRATHFWDKKFPVASGGISSEMNTAASMAFGKLPPLAPGRKYVAEPSIAIFDGGEIGDGTVETGTYTNGRMFIGMFAWTAFD